MLRLAKFTLGQGAYSGNMTAYFPMLSDLKALAPLDLKSAIIRDPLVVSIHTSVMAAITQMSGVRSQPAPSDLASMGSAYPRRFPQSSCAVVVDGDRVVGLLTERDVVRLGAEQQILEQLPVQQVMAHPVVTLRESEFSHLLVAVNLLQQHQIRHLPILDDQDRLVGVITHESLQSMAQLFELLRLRLTSEVMTREVICATPDCSMLTIAQRMTAHRVSSVVIVTPVEAKDTSASTPTISLGRPVGLITERDLVQFQALGYRLEDCPVAPVMSKPVFAVPPTETLWTVQQIMTRQRIRRVVVTDDQGELVGIITHSSLLHTLNPLELYKLAELLEAKVTRLEAEKLALLESRTTDLEQQVEARTASLQTQTEREMLVVQIALRIRTSLNLQEILGVAVAEVRSFLVCDRVVVYQFQPDGSGLIVAESVGAGWASALGNNIQAGCFQSQSAQLYQSDQPIVVNDIEAAGYTDCHRQLLAQYQVKANLVVPMWVDGRLWGFLIGHQCNDCRHWLSQDATLLQTIAIHLAIAIQQATTHQQLQAELADRKRAELALAQLNAELEQRVEQRTAELLKREARYRALMAGASDAIILADAQGNLIEANPKAEALLGYSRDELAHLHMTQIHPPQVLVAAQAHFQSIITGQPGLTLESLVQRKDGQLVPVAITGSCIALDGQPIAQGIFRDISYRLQAEQENRQLKDRLQFLLASSLAVIYSCEPGGNFACNFISQNVSTVLGYTPADFLADPKFWSQRLHPDDAPQVFADLTTLFETGVLTHEYRFLHQQGHYLWLRDELRLVRNQQGEPIEIVGYCADISDRKQAELALQDSETRFRRVFESSVVGMVFADFQGHILEANDHFLQMVGYSRADLEIGAIHWNAMTPPQYVPGDVAAMEHLMQHGVISPWEKEYYRKDGSRVPILMGAALLPGRTDQTICIMVDISDHKATEAALRRSEERWQLALAGSNDGIWDWDVVNGRVFFSRRWKQMRGYRESELDDDLNHWRQGIHPDDLERVLAAVQDHFQGNTAYFEQEYRVRRKDGTYMWVLDRGQARRNDQGQVIRMAGSESDITARKQAEFRLQQQAHQERLLASITRQVRSSLNLAEILNATVQEVHQVLQTDRVLVYRVLPNGTGATIAEAVNAPWSRLLDRVFPAEVFPQENYERYVQGRIFALNDRDGENHQVLPCLLEFLIEIQVQAKLVVPIVQQQTLWGLLIAHQCDGPRQWQPWEQTLLHQVADQLAIAIQQATLVEQLQQELQERQQTQQLLTERNQQLAIFNQELARATRLKDEFLANMSHELRTPLNAILGMTEGLQEGVFGQINDRQLRALETVASSGTHLLALINDILDVAKIESGQLTLDRQPTAVDLLCHSSLAFIKQQALSKHIQVALHLPPHLPALWVDERRIRQVLINLLNNAVKFTPAAGQITLTVTLLSPESSPELPPELPPESSPEFTHPAVPASPPCYLRLAVSDTGIGIAPEHRDQLFQPFIQIDSALNRQYTGTGLGLALVKRIVERHGGRVGLTSELGVGSCFTIDLPCATHPAVVSVSTPEPRSDSLPSTQPSSPLILLAEDNLANISTVGNYLRAKGYRLVLAKTGEEAVALTQTDSPDLILMDIQMPGMDGLEAIAQIRRLQQGETLPIIALTALAMAGDRERCLAAGANEYLSKPVKLRQLTTIIQALLSDG